MATKTKDPMKTKTGRTRLGPLGVDQLTTMLAGTKSGKVKARITRALEARVRTQTVGKPKPEVVVESAVEVAAAA